MGKFATAQSLELRKSAIWRRCPRRKSPELDPKEQFKRFVETAHPRRRSATSLRAASSAELAGTS